MWGWLHLVIGRRDRAVVVVAWCRGLRFLGPALVAVAAVAAAAAAGGGSVLSLDVLHEGVTVREGHGAAASLASESLATALAQKRENNEDKSMITNDWEWRGGRGGGG